MEGGRGGREGGREGGVREGEGNGRGVDNLDRYAPYIIISFKGICLKFFTSHPIPN